MCDIECSPVPWKHDGEYFQQPHMSSYSRIRVKMQHKHQQSCAAAASIIAVNRVNPPLIKRGLFEKTFFGFSAAAAVHYIMYCSMEREHIMRYTQRKILFYILPKSNALLVFQNKLSKTPQCFRQSFSKPLRIILCNQHFSYFFDTSIYIYHEKSFVAFFALCWLRSFLIDWHFWPLCIYSHILNIFIAWSLLSQGQRNFS